MGLRSIIVERNNVYLHRTDSLLFRLYSRDTHTFCRPPPLPSASSFPSRLLPPFARVILYPFVIPLSPAEFPLSPVTSHLSLRLFAYSIALLFHPLSVLFTSSSFKVQSLYSLAHFCPFHVTRVFLENRQVCRYLQASDNNIRFLAQ